ncbi:hypothetical protein [Tautonia plasticadhaerens]|uniref:Neutral/alkaline non-lysosomal ceramidase n=1 Tax=Tautonia plasticadhaerens TaxID=2527974 RepID=A0A518HDX7_9BACT|nr:hypothetical protein [Tautonia plasticadhaerens]QDV39040.1 hypothetical protein ElP_70010 [Tautonia plasticadhaerens]
MTKTTRASRRTPIPVLLALLLPALSPAPGRSAELRVGAATTSITPDRPVALSGQMTTRIAEQVESPVTATALAIEARQGDEVVDQAILVSCDLVAIREGLVDRVRRRLGDRLPDFDPRKLILSATHTHTAPVLVEGQYDLPEDGIIRPAEYVEFLVDRVAEAAATAWEGRAPSTVGWGLGHAVVAQNRRAVYDDGRAVMYGPTDRPDFRDLEGFEDHGVEVLFFWGEDGALLATAINVACPSQEVEGRSAVNADFWHQVRESLRARHGEQLHVLGWTGAAGDQSPHLMFRERAEERMRTLRGLDRLDELARRVVRAWEEAFEGARQEIRDDVPMAHTVRTIELPVRRVTEEEYEDATEQVEALSADPASRRRMLWHQEVVDRYDRQRSGEVAPYAMELHAIRIGDVAIATNDFELFTSYGLQMKARSRALQTFVIQLAGPGTYLPTPRAVQGGGYSAIVESSVVGPEGGQVLVDRTVEAINALWPEP